MRTNSRRRCPHRRLTVHTERDKCSWVACEDCHKRGPKKHSYTLAVIAWTLHLTNQHPRSV